MSIKSYHSKLESTTSISFSVLIFHFFKLILLAILTKAQSQMDVQVQNLTVGEQTRNLINSHKEHIYRVEYNSTVNRHLNVKRKN